MIALMSSVPPLMTPWSDRAELLVVRQREIDIWSWPSASRQC